MKRLLLSAAAAMCWIAATPGAAHADDNLKRVQQSLRDQGFYYGVIDGAPGDETTQAIRRYQIRNGLQVSGQLNDETRASILRNSGGGSAPDAAPAASGNKSTVTVTPTGTPRPRSTPSVSAPGPAITPRAGSANANIDDDGGFHRNGGVNGNPPITYRSAPSSSRDDEDTSPARPPARPDLRVPPGDADAAPRVVPPSGVAPSAPLTAMFEGTPYEFAPPPVQAETLRRAQHRLLKQGFYDREPDGRLNPVMAEALTNYQGFNRLRRTGRLDTATLASMRLLPGERAQGGFGQGGFRQGQDPVFQGRVVQ